MDVNLHPGRRKKRTRRKNKNKKQLRPVQLIIHYSSVASGSLLLSGLSFGNRLCVLVVVPVGFPVSSFLSSPCTTLPCVFNPPSPSLVQRFTICVPRFTTLPLYFIPFNLLGRPDWSHTRVYLHDGRCPNGSVLRFRFHLGLSGQNWHLTSGTFTRAH